MIMCQTNCIIENGVVVGFEDIYQKEVVIPEGVTEIKNFAFHEYYGLEKITLPFSLKHIGEYAFRKCTNLRSICVPAQVDSIGEGAFYDCTELIYADLLYTQIQEIPRALFAHCHRLKGVFLPENIKRIGSISFLECNDIRYFKVPLNLQICESVPPMAHLKCFCISDEIIHLEGLKRSSNNDTKIFVSSNQYTKFKKEIPDCAKVFLVDNPMQAYSSAYLTVTTENMETELDYLLNMLSDSAELKESPCLSEYFPLVSNRSAKTKIVSMSFLCHNQIYSIKELFEIEIKDKFKGEYTYRYKKEEFDGLANFYKEGIVAKDRIDDFALDFLDTKDYPNKKINKKDNYWELKMLFESGQKVCCRCTDFEHGIHIKLLGYFGEYINS